MENINTDKLYKFISQASILFLLFLIIYLMYIDFIREKMSNKKIYQSSLQEKFNNLISNNEQKITFDKNDLTGLTLQNMKRKKLDVIENFMPVDPKLKYIIKRNYSMINNAKCVFGDYSNIEQNNCHISISNFYPTSTYLNTSINIYPLPDFIVDPDKNKNTFYAKIKNENGEILSYNDYIKPDGDNVINLGYKSNYFNFSNSKSSRKFDLKNPLELKIIQYFARYIKYGMYISTKKNTDIDSINGLLNDNQFNKLDLAIQQKITQLKESIINDIQNMLLLKSGFQNTFNLPANIYNIKQLLIQYYASFFNDPSDKYKDTDLIITDKSVLTLLIDPKTKSDDVNNITIYSIIFKISVNIQLINLEPILTDNTLDPKILTSLSYLNHLEYAKNANYIYSYENTISFPIALPFNLPNLTSTTVDGSKLTGSTLITDKTTITKTVDVSDNKWYDDINTYLSTLFIDNRLLERVKINDSTIESGVDAITNIMNSINPLKNDINNLSNITDIFACFIPDNNNYTSTSGVFYFKIILIDKKFDVLALKNNYIPYLCDDPSESLFNRKCLPKCPENYNIDLGLICLKQDISNFTPNSDFCAQLTVLKQTGAKDTILNGLFEACNIENINNISNESLLNIDDTPGIIKTNKNNYILENSFIDPELLSSSVYNDSSSDNLDSTFDTSFNNVNTKIVQHFDNINIPTLQSMTTRNNKIRYDVKSREETKPEINKQTGKKILHFSPFLN